MIKKSKMSAAGKYGMRLFPDLVRVAAGIHFGSGPFPARV